LQAIIIPIEQCR